MMKLLMVPVSLVVALSMLQVPNSTNPDDDVAVLRTELRQIELALRAGAGQLNNPVVDQEAQKRGLEDLVEHWFDLRQQLQQREAERLRQKLEEVEKNLAARAKNRTAIIEQRIRELQIRDRQGIDRTNPSGGPSAEPLVDQRPAKPTVPSSDLDLTLAEGPVGFLAQQGQSTRELRAEVQKLRNDWMGLKARVEPIKLAIEKLSLPLDELKADDSMKHITSEERRLEELARVKHLWDQHEQAAKAMRLSMMSVWAEYESRVTLLKLEVEKARVKVAAAQDEYEVASKLVAAGNVSKALGDEKATELKLRTLELQQFEALLKMHENFAATDSELNPASIPAEIPPPSQPEGSTPADGMP